MGQAPFFYIRVANLDLPTVIEPAMEIGWRASVGGLFSRLYRLGLLTQCVEEAVSTLQILCKPHPRLGKIGEMLS